VHAAKLKILSNIHGVTTPPRLTTVAEPMNSTSEVKAVSVSRRPKTLDDLYEETRRHNR